MAFGLRSYIDILSVIQQDNFVATPEFRKAFNGFYRVRQKSAAWYDKYYGLMEEQRSANRSFRELLFCLEKISGTIDVSFASKMLAAIDPMLPIWDKYVLQNLGLLKRWEKMASKDGKACIAALDSAMSHYKEKLTEVKKIDFLLWSMR